MREELGAPQPPTERQDTQEAVAAAREEVGESAWAAAYAAGQALPLEAAIALALVGVEEREAREMDGEEKKHQSW